MAARTPSKVNEDREPTHDLALTRHKFETLSFDEPFLLVPHHERILLIVNAPLVIAMSKAADRVQFARNEGVHWSVVLRLVYLVGGFAFGIFLDPTVFLFKVYEKPLAGDKQEAV